MIIDGKTSGPFTVAGADITAVLISLIQPFVDADDSLQHVELSADTDMVEELGLSSLQVMELIEQVEDEFDIAYPLNDLADVRTVRDLCAGVEHLLE